jgi:hypothetical protein
MPASPAPQGLAPVHGEDSWSLAADRVSLHVTRRGAHLAPIRFRCGPASAPPFSPYSLAPWEPGEHPDAPPLLQILRGDFFCFPFGCDPAGGHAHIHGETANRPWSLLESSPGRLRLALDFAPDGPLAGGRIEKTITLVPGHAALYQEHLVSGVSGDFNYGHHPILLLPEGVHTELRASPLRFRAVYPYPPGDGSERNALAGGARFASLSAAPLAGGGASSLLRYPARPGHEDIVMLSAAASTGPAWTALTFSTGFVWVSLRDAALFPSTLLWMSDGGRDAAPWRGRHSRRIGVEDVCSHFCDGAGPSRASELPATEGITTTRRFEATRPTSLRHVQFAAALPPAFGGMARIDFHAGADRVTLHGEGGASVDLALDWRYCLAR